MTETSSGQLLGPQGAEYHESSFAKHWNDVPYESTRLNLLDICVPKRQPEDPGQAVWLV
jgi:kynurenine formamidase